MSSNLHHQIYDEMNLKETDELLEIWQNNDRFEWSDIAFDVINEILKERGVKIPNQNEPIYDHNDEKTEEDYNFSEEELRIIEDENPPAFYDPFEVLLAAKRIDWMAKVMIVFTIAYNIINFPRLIGIVQSYFIRNPNSILIYIFTILLVALNTGMGSIVIYFPLKALSRILRVLMEMEFRSRKGTQSNALVE